MDIINFILKVPKLPDAFITNTDSEYQPAIDFTSGYRLRAICARAMLSADKQRPNVHTYLRELNKRVFSKYNMCTVGEMPCGVDPYKASRYVARESREFSIVLQFSHMEIDNTDGDKWTVHKWTPPPLEEILRIWQQHMLGNHSRIPNSAGLWRLRLIYVPGWN
ncbi:glycoside hydrolase family 13 protein [Zopfia rhizophila CBS 207.26]|uniref:Glycoside hydrolase family 13 protein n=1 Tax=Zopfia rhizophila CBS 207.26 TaxID=1314779 RepID=A0A6A6D8U8_9PEZI|nr:glycoside hydrolase family 13 protein [Zopfia rhizophila CBS 207.26]